MFFICFVVFFELSFFFDSFVLEIDIYFIEINDEVDDAFNDDLDDDDIE